MEYQPIHIHINQDSSKCWNRRDEESHCVADEEAAFWFEEGEADAAAGTLPQHQENYYYLLGYDDMQYRASLGVKL